jgi:hypothetical protein
MSCFNHVSLSEILEKEIFNVIREDLKQVLLS